MENEEMIALIDNYIEKCETRKEKLLKALKNDPEDENLKLSINILNNRIAEFSESKRKYHPDDSKKEKLSILKKLKSLIKKDDGEYHEIKAETIANLVVYSSLALSASSTYALVTNSVTPGFEPYIATLGLSGVLVGGIKVAGKIITSKKEKKSEAEKKEENLASINFKQR